MVSLELFLPTYQSRSVTDYRQIDIYPVGTTKYINSV